MNTFKHTLPALLLAGMGFASTASASLETRPGGMVYDTNLNITWLQDANYAQTSGYDADGLMDWNTAMTWAANLVYGGYDDWRLPTVSPINGTSFQYGFSNNGSTDAGYGNTSPASELAYMYYVNLGNLGYCTPNGGGSGGCVAQPGWGLTNVGPFTNLQSSVYWSGTEFAPFPYAWDFNTGVGNPNLDYKNNAFYGWAVRSGDVAAVPLPAAVWLFGSALSGVGMLAVRRRRG
ncbi:MAG: DUF1566 domain-containing protein [Candidatus Methylumidiphilus sp.]